MNRIPCRCVRLLICGILAGCSGDQVSPPMNGHLRDTTAHSDYSVPVLPTRSVERIAHRAKSQGDHPFHRVDASTSGIDFENRLDPDHPLSRIYYSGYASGGVAIGDMDGDGRCDLFLVHGPGDNRLYRQVADWKFDDVTQWAGVAGGDAWGAGAALVDIDNDLDLDIYVCNYDAPNQLFINQGDGRFVESAQQWGLDVVDASMFPAFCDFDRDGDLDLYLLTNRYRRAGGRPESPPYRVVDGKPEVLPEYEKYYALSEREPGRYGIDDYGREDYLFVNDGQGRFEDHTSSSGIFGHGDGLSATWFDYDQDGWPDLYVCNDFDEPDRLYRNRGDGTFDDELLGTVSHTTWSSMGADAGDINNDGYPDLFVLDMSGTNHFKQKTTMGSMNSERIASVAGPPPQYMRNALHVNAGNGRFLEAAYLAGLAATDWSWAAKLADFDGDGRIDVFVTNGVVRSFNDSDIPFSTSMLVGKTEWDIFKDTPPRREQNLAFRNEGDLAFSDVSSQWGLGHVGISYGAAWGDIDNDGDLDLVVANVDEPVSLYRNDDADGQEITFRLVGRASNRFGLGASIEIETSDGKQFRELSPLTGFLSCNQAIVHFGMGNTGSAERVTIRWPSGASQELENLPAGHHFIVTEPPANRDQEADPSSGRPVPLPPQFVASGDFPKMIHTQEAMDDFALQPLLPNKLSQFGPGMAWGDVDLDGDDDLYVGGGLGQVGTLWIRNNDRTFEQREVTDFAQHKEHDDLGCLFFDADGDRDLDLYVVSGGLDVQRLADRLYLNRGDGMFSYVQDRLPEQRVSGSVVVANDFDQDGDLDLFVGGRLIPGDYPLAPTSQLLQNDSGVFIDVVDHVAPGLSHAGMATSAIWSDVNEDGWDDLLVTYEWGPVRIYLNERGTLRDATASYGLAEFTGWWNGIASGDVDNDGDIDYVATNFGLNTKYHASRDTPALLYYGDFDNTGRMRLVEAEYEDQQLFPVRGKSCSTRAMPFLGDKFTSYRNFAAAELADIYTNERLSSAHQFTATTLETTLFLNEGPRLRAVPLPRLAQVSPAFGVIMCDVNGDGNLDVGVVQNFFGPQPETGHMDGGLGLLLLGDGHGQFKPLWPNQSGFVVPEDGMSLTTVDLDGDGALDLVAATNQGPVHAFLNDIQTPQGFRQINVRLKGPAGNPTGVGARVTLICEGGGRQVREIQAGGGYLSQSSAVANFSCPPEAKPARLEVRWPRGGKSVTVVEPQRDTYLLVPAQSGD